MNNYELTDEKLLKKVCLFLNNLNDNFKNVYNGEPEYVIENGVILVHGNKQITPYIYGEAIDPKDTSIEEIQKLLSCNIRIDKQELFEFLKQRKYVNGIFVTGNEFKITTSLIDLNYTSTYYPLEKKNFKPDPDSLFESFTIDEKEIEKIFELNNEVSAMYLDLDTKKAIVRPAIDSNNLLTCNSSVPKELNNYLTINLNKKFLCGFRKTKKETSSITKINLYDFDVEKSFYILEIEVLNKKFKTTHFLALVDY